MIMLYKKKFHCHFHFIVIVIVGNFSERYIVFYLKKKCSVENVLREMTGGKCPKGK